MLTPKHFASFAASRAVGSLAAAALLFVIAACGGAQGAASSGGGSAAATPAAVPATASPATASPAAANPSISQPLSAAQLEKVAHQVFAGERYPVDCNWRDRSICPVTDRLGARLTELAAPPASGPGQVSLFCRCQNPAETMQVTTEPTSTGGVAHVALIYSPSLHVRIDLVVIRLGDRALVDDTLCTGRGSGTSVYEASLAGCA
jgi:hypothetical protein